MGSVKRYWWGIVLALTCVLPARAGEVEIVAARLARKGALWQASVTLRHGDTGWEHYANAWRLVTETGQVLGTRTLRHPHVEEQPFTRTLEDVAIPDDVSTVYVEARDSVHGWASKRLRVAVNRDRGAESGDE